MSDSLHFELKGGKELREAFRKAADRAEAALSRGLYLEAEAVMAASKREVPVDQGILRASGHVQPPKTERGKIVVVLGYGGAAKGYALYLHEGTGPAVGRPAFHPPVQPFKEWARRVLGDESLGYAVARAVGQRGLKPRKYLERPLKRRMRGMGARLAAYMKREVEHG